MNELKTLEMMINSILFAVEEVQKVAPSEHGRGQIEAYRAMLIMIRSLSGESPRDEGGPL